MNFKNYLNEDQILLQESSLGRILQHIQKEKLPSWCILTSFRKENSPSQNNTYFKQLKEKVNGLNLGFIELIGFGQEEDENGNVKQVKERSLFIPGIERKQAQKLSDYYNQWGYIYSGPETGEDAYLISIEGRERIGKFVPNKIAEFYSKINGRPFTFVKVEPATMMEKYWNHLKEK